MINAKTVLEIDSQIIDYKDYYDIQIYSSIKDHLPILTFKLRDDAGTYWSELNFSVGSIVRVYYVGTLDQQQQIWPSTKFVIQKMYNGFELNNNSTLGGYVQITCVQAWSFYGDYTSHAYDCQKMGDLIKTICKNAKKGAELRIEDDWFAASSDSGSIKYKVACSDYEFITQKLLPFTMVDSSNSLFYVTRMGNVHLSGFNTLYSANEKTLLCPDLGTSLGAIEALTQVKAAKNLTSHAYYISIEADIAPNERMKDELKQKVYIYDYQNESTKIGLQTPAINAGTDSEKVKKTYTPIKNEIIDDVSATSSFYIANRNFEEQIAAARNALTPTNNLLNISIYLSTFIPEVEIGDTVFLWIPPTKSPTGDVNEDGTPQVTDKVKTHWLVGKWLVASEACITLEQGTVAVRYNLIRPAFDIAIEGVSLADYKTFYKVK